MLFGFAPPMPLAHLVSSPRLLCSIRMLVRPSYVMIKVAECDITAETDLPDGTVLRVIQAVVGDDSGCIYFTAARGTWGWKLTCLILMERCPSWSGHGPALQPPC